MRCAVLLTLLTAGCTPLGWHRTNFPPQLDSHSQYQIWSHGTAAQWHGVIITWDSVTGIPHNQSLKCDSCRRSIARTEVDSICRAKPSAGSVAAEVVVLVLLII